MITGDVRCVQAHALVNAPSGGTASYMNLLNMCSTAHDTLVFYWRRGTHAAT